MQDPTQFQTGIYRHFKKGDLYFAEGLELDADVNVDTFRVRYHALYPGKPFPFSKRLNGIGGFVDGMVIDPNKPTMCLATEVNLSPRFTLIQELPAEKLQMLIPGTKVELPCDDGIQKLTVRDVVEMNGKILVRLLSQAENCDPVPKFRLAEISELLNSFSKSSE